MRRRPAQFLVGSLLLTALAGCNHGSGVQLSPLSSTLPNAAPSPSTTGEQAAVLSQYRTFWSSLTAVSRMPAGAREAALARYTVDPELRSLIAGMSTLDQQGRVLYGVNRPRPVASVSANGVTAVVNDCQDSTGAGAADRKTLRQITVGVARNHVVVTMKKTAGVWKVAFVAYSQTPC